MAHDLIACVTEDGEDCEGICISESNEVMEVVMWVMLKEL